MFGFLKKLIGKSEPPPPPPPAPAPAPPAPAPPKAAPASVPEVSRTVAPATSSRPTARPITPIAPVAHAAPATPAVAPTVTFSGPTLDLPLKKLWPKLSPALTQIATGHPGSDAMLKLPLALIQPMLAKGAVKMPYAQFRQFAPSGLLPERKEALEVEVPLGEVLSRMKPDQLARRAQKKVEVPDDIGPVFGPRGAGLRVSDNKPVAAAPAPPPETPVVEPPKPAPVAEIATKVAPAPTVELQAPAPTPPPPPAPMVNEPIRAPKLDPSLASLKPKPAEAVFNLALMDVAAHWTATGKKELENLYRHSLEIPAATLENALKTGKLIFQWREVRPWIRMASGHSLPTIADDFLIELPLAIVAPRFMEQRGQGKPRKRVQVGDDIPDLFAQKGPSPDGPLPVPEAASAAPQAMPAAPGAAMARPALDFGEIFGQPDKKIWTLAEVTQKTVALRGVAGALIATSDGLLVAGTWPAGVQTESVAAFIPQMYSRMVQCTKELKLGEPGNFTLTIENVPLQIFKTGGNYFSVLGRAGENLPKAQINALAMRLAMTQPVK